MYKPKLVPLLALTLAAVIAIIAVSGVAIKLIDGFGRFT
jgi:hypothetical protein